MPQTSCPLHLSLAGRRVVVVGGGPVAARKVAACLAAGADVLVVAPYACEQIVAEAAAGTLGWHERDYRAGDLDGAWLVVRRDRRPGHRRGGRGARHRAADLLRPGRRRGRRDGAQPRGASAATTW